METENATTELKRIVVAQKRIILILVIFGNAALLVFFFVQGMSIFSSPIRVHILVLIIVGVYTDIQLLRHVKKLNVQIKTLASHT